MELYSNDIDPPHNINQSLYDRMPIDYPDAFTINMAKVLQEGRWVRCWLLKEMIFFFNRILNDNNDNMITIQN